MRLSVAAEPFTLTWVAFCQESAGRSSKIEHHLRSVSIRRIPCVTPTAAAVRSGGRLECCRPPIPRQQLVQARCRMIADPVEHIRQPGSRIDIIQFGGDDERIHRCSPFATAIGTSEQPCLATQRNPAQRPFGGIVRQTDPAIVNEPAEGNPALQHVVDRLCHVGVARHLAAHIAHPAFEDHPRERRSAPAARHDAGRWADH